MCALISGHFYEPKMTSGCSNDLAAVKNRNKKNTLEKQKYARFIEGVTSKLKMCKRSIKLCRIVLSRNILA